MSRRSSSGCFFPPCFRSRRTIPTTTETLLPGSRQEPGTRLEESMLSELSPSRTSVPTQYPQTRKLIMVSNRGPDRALVRRRRPHPSPRCRWWRGDRPQLRRATTARDLDRQRRHRRRQGRIAILGQRSQIGRESDLRLLDLPSQGLRRLLRHLLQPHPLVRPALHRRAAAPRGPRDGRRSTPGTTATSR